MTLYGDVLGEAEAGQWGAWCSHIRVQLEDSIRIGLKFGSFH